MKVCMFHLNPHRKLPPDFEQRFETSRVTAPAWLLDPEDAADFYNLTLDEMELAASLGFDAVCVNEHHQSAYGFMTSPNLMAAALARRTEECALVVLGATTALYQPATRLAEEYAMLDCISRGRLVAGFPIGSSADANFAYGIPPSHTRPRFYEAHDLIIKAWTTNEPFAWNGRFNRLRHVNTWPKPLQKPHPPIWMTGTRSVETWDYIIDHDYAYNYLSYFGAEAAARNIEGFWEHGEAKGMDRNPFRLGFLQLVCVSETDARAEQEYAEHVAYFYQKGLLCPPYYNNAPGYMTTRSFTHAIRGGMTLELASVSSATPDWRRYVEDGYVIAGSAETVRERLRAACETAGIGHLMVLLQIGSMPHDLTEKNIRLFAEDVLPYVRDLFEDEWEDRWWPSATRRARAAPAHPRRNGPAAG